MSSKQNVLFIIEKKTHNCVFSLLIIGSMSVNVLIHPVHLR